MVDFLCKIYFFPMKRSKIYYTTFFGQEFGGTICKNVAFFHKNYRNAKNLTNVCFLLRGVWAFKKSKDKQKTRKHKLIPITLQNGNENLSKYKVGPDFMFFWVRAPMLSINTERATRQCVRVTSTSDHEQISDKSGKLTGTLWAI